jgi:hydrogenase assembly chaperone HypC/HupF
MIPKNNLRYNSNMCLAIPGKVKSIEGRKVIVEYPHEERQVINGDMDIKVGDFVMVQMGIVINVLSEKDAKVSWEAWKSST